MREPWIIYAQDGDAVKELATGSVRRGRTLRRAIAMKRYMNCKVFISNREPSLLMHRIYATAETNEILARTSSQATNADMPRRCARSGKTTKPKGER